METAASFEARFAPWSYPTTRTMEIKELSVPVEKLEQLKSFYRVIVGDERNTAVLKPAGK